MMNINKIGILLATLLLIISSCADESLSPVVTFDSAAKGAYPRLVTQSADKLINLFDVAGSSYTYTVEFIDEQKGKLVTEYILTLQYNNNTPKEFKRFTASDFQTNEAGNQQAPAITITGTEAIAAAGLTNAQVQPGDQFKFIGKVILQDGSSFTQSNSSATVGTGAAFRGHFNFTLSAGCPSALAGSYEYTTSDLWCGKAPVSGKVNIVSQGGGTYKFSDWAFGAYGPCYGSGVAEGNLTFKDVCAVVSFTGFTDSFGDTWTFVSSIEGENWNIKWSNTYGEGGTSVVKFPGGVPFTLK